MSNQTKSYRYTLPIDRVVHDLVVSGSAVSPPEHAAGRAKNAEQQLDAKPHGVGAASQR